MDTASTKTQNRDTGSAWNSVKMLLGYMIHARASALRNVYTWMQQTSVISGQEKTSQ